MKNTEPIKTIQLTERIVVRRKTQLYEQLDYLTFKTKNLYNSSLFRNRSIFFDNQYNGTRNPLETYNQQDVLLKTHNDYKELPAKVAQQVLKLADKNWKSYWASIKSYAQNPSKFKAYPKPPYYLDSITGRQVACYTIQAISSVSLKQGCIQLSGIDCSIKSRVAKKASKSSKYRINQVRVVQKLGYYVVEVIYTRRTIKHKLSNKRVAAIDLGINCLAALTFNGKRNPRLFNGKPVKSINRYYNKLIAKAKSQLQLGIGTSKRIQALWRRRECKIKHYLHCCSKQIVDVLISNHVGSLVVGYNKGWKQKLNIGSVNNQKFAMIPFTVFTSLLGYKCELHGIKFIQQEESYTSKASFLDNDVIPVFNGKSSKKHSFSGKRKHRGLYVSSNGTKLNADVNGSLNIMRKVTDKMINIKSVLAFVVAPVTVHVRCA